VAVDSAPLVFDPKMLASLGAVLGVFGGAIGSSIGIGKAASAALPVVSEDPASFKQVVILAALPITQTFYGFIFALLSLMNVLPAIDNMSWFKAGAIFGVGLFVMAAELFSAWEQGIICMSGILELPKAGGRMLTPSLILASYVEMLGILGLVLGYLLVTVISGLPI